MLIEINPYNIDSRLIDQAVNALRKGELIIIPTDSVYAIACDLDHPKALKKLAEFKGVKLKKAKFSILCQDQSQIATHVRHLERPVFKLLNNHLPGPFTFILNASKEIAKKFDNRKEIGVRIPDNLIIQHIVEQLGNPLCATSLHNDDEPHLEYYTDPYNIYEKYDDQAAMIIDGGIGSVEASTVVNCLDGIHIDRQGIGIIEL